MRKFSSARELSSPPMLTSKPMVAGKVDGVAELLQHSGPFALKLDLNLHVRDGEWKCGLASGHSEWKLECQTERRGSSPGGGR